VRIAREEAMKHGGFGTRAGDRRGLSMAAVVVTSVALGVLGFALYTWIRGPADDKRSGSAVRSTAPDRPRIAEWHGRGIDITEVIEGRPVYTLKVERVRFEPASLGFLRVGFIQAPVLEDARLTVYADETSEGTAGPLGAVEAAVATLLKRQELGNLGWLVGVTGVGASPLRVLVIRDNREVLAFSSARATVDLRQRRLDLAGQVRFSVDGGARVLESDRVSFSLKTHQIWTDDEVRLQTPEGRVQKQGFSGDVFLRTVNVRPVGTGEANIGQEQATRKVEREARQ
jgi:hypothetical protein